MTFDGFFFFLIAWLCVAAAWFWIRPVRELHSFDKQQSLRLKGILALLVVVGHASSMVGIGFSWATLAVAVFFFISGYGLVKSYERMAAVGGNYLAGFLSRSFRKLVPSLLLMTIAYQVYLACVGRTGFCVVREFLVCGETPLPYSWFVYALLYFYLCFWLSWRLRSVLWRVSAVFAATLLYLVVMKYVVCWPWWWKLTVMAFPVGCGYACVEERVIGTVRRTNGLVLAAMAVALIPFLILGFRYGYVGLLLPLWLTGPMVILCLSVTPLRFGDCFGRVSYELYLVHGVVLGELLRLRGGIVGGGGGYSQSSLLWHRLLRLGRCTS